MKDIIKDIEYYLALPYRIMLYPAEEGGFVVEIPELPGCISQGETREDALVMIEDAKIAWLQVALELGRDIPEPAEEEESFSGKFVLRLPKSLHRDLAKKAKEENVSLNQLATYLLSTAMGKPPAIKK
ncbi:type II toxin-antitoxin system HicB family antitoxin [Desulforamulus aquiferis]|uniref:Toxin-antitoxin system HicB family antitoxin n=1 Tax=Desulforamulus aquiferis TaxID=1397668 RepID=A0AAW7ZG79_9FIRM|nr:type II toxin-antitoxin system HicB family antitoxin [Desulforamulus aquiferis]MDO7788204.1 toxin-antitoxin system HicB family antitoxin [Desulforamulus aquiferis]